MPRGPIAALQAALQPLQDSATRETALPGILNDLEAAIRAGADVNGWWSVDTYWRTDAMAVLLGLTPRMVEGRGKLAELYPYKFPGLRGKNSAAWRAFRLAVFRRLLAAGLNVQRKSRICTDWLRAAIHRDDVPLACALADAGADVDGRGSPDYPLAACRSAGMVAALVARGADVAAYDARYGTTVLRAALEAGAPPAAVAALVEHGAPLVDAADAAGCGLTVLHYACSRAQARALLDAGARVTVDVLEYWMGGCHGGRRCMTRSEAAAILGDEAWARRRHAVAAVAAARRGAARA